MALYVEYVSSKSLNPLPHDNDVSEVVAAVGHEPDSKLRSAYRKGLAVLSYCRQRAPYVQYSPISVVELVTGRARGHAILDAAREGVPDRMWSKIDEKYVDQRVAGNVLTDILGRVEALKETLERLDLVPEGGAKSAAMSWDLTERLAGLVYISVTDMMILAGALDAGAKYLITFDSYLADKVNKINSSQSRRYCNIRRELGTLVGDPTFPLSPGFPELAKYCEGMLDSVQR